MRKCVKVAKPASIKEDTMKDHFYDEMTNGGVLLRLKGAIQNLKEAMSAENASYILKRRVELSEIIASLNLSIHFLPSKSVSTQHLMSSTNEAIEIAKTMLHDASAYLSTQLELAKAF